MPTPNATIVIDKTVNHLSQNPGIAALVLVGSQVEGNKFSADQFSDIELYVVSPDDRFTQTEKEIMAIDKIFPPEDVVLSYKNQWAGWSVLFTNLLRLELPVVKASDDKVFGRSEEQKMQILYSKPGFQLKRAIISAETNNFQIELENAIKDFWYMAVYAAQHIGRGEIWIARDAVRISMQGKVKRLLQEIYHKDTIKLERDRRIELTWSQEELAILKETSSTYDRSDLIRAFWANIKWTKNLLKKMGFGLNAFESYERKLIPEIQRNYLLGDVTNTG